tara:strand:+ start:88 stop:432 length:345 start_codon:yes stop_codon:yes gene_type:complete
MNKEFLHKWICALQSTEYKQIRYNLCLDGSYCAIGIACKEVMNVKDIHMYNKGEIREINIEKYKNQELFKRKYGNDDYEFIHEELMSCVASLNDDECFSFYDISVWLETNVEGI